MSEASGREAAREGGLVVDPGDPVTVASSRSFGAAASVYHQARPGYPIAAIEWLVGDAVRVLDLGAGTGKLTAALVADIRQSPGFTVGSPRGSDRNGTAS